MILWQQLALCLKKHRSIRAKCFVATSGLGRRSACESFTTSWFEEMSSLLATSCPINQTEERKIVIFETPFDGIDEQKARGFQRTITGNEFWFFYYPCSSVWRRRVMGFLNSSNTTLTWKVLGFDPLVG
jgi:hypothetical protein